MMHRFVAPHASSMTQFATVTAVAYVGLYYLAFHLRLHLYPFTLESEADGCTPTLDTKIIYHQDGFLFMKVYQKRTRIHSDMYLECQSHHLLAYNMRQCIVFFCD